MKMFLLMLMYMTYKKTSYLEINYTLSGECAHDYTARFLAHTVMYQVS